MARQTTLDFLCGWQIALTLTAAILLFVLSAPTSAHAAAQVPAFDHIFVVVMENRSQAEIIGNTTEAPYINQLASQFGVADNYTAVAHPSLPNYLALIGGDTFGTTTDCTTCFVRSPNLVADRLAPSGRTWKAYMENMPPACFLGDSYPYAQRHNPFVYFDDIRLTPQCSNVVPLNGLAADLSSTATTPIYVWLTPNLCNDMHDCSIASGDAWLKNTVPMILGSPAFRSQNSLMVLTWDEDDSTQSNRVPMLVISPQVPPGFHSTMPYTHYSLLKTIESAWGLAPLGSNDTAATPMSDFFAPAAAGQPVVQLASPVRLADTRLTGGPIASGSSRCFAVGGTAGIPSDAASAVLNVTAVGFLSSGWLTLYPNGQSVPSTSIVDFDPGEYAIANGTFVKLGTAGQACVYVGMSSANVVLDAVGYIPRSADSAVTLLASPQRLIDSRVSGGPLAAGSSRCVPVANRGGMPGDAGAALLNVTAVTYSASGWLTLYANGQPTPTTSTLNFQTKTFAVANGAVVKLGVGGQVCVLSGSSSANFILDAMGYVSSNGLTQLPMLTSPQRLVDTRVSGGPIAAGSSRCFQVGGNGGIPPSAAAVVLNVTAVSHTGNGWLTLYPRGQPVPATSTVNFDVREVAIANNAVARLGTSGQVCVNSGNSSANVILDAIGYELAQQ